PAADLLASLREDDFGARRHGHQELLLPLGAQMVRRATIHQACRNVVRQREIADLPDGKIARETVRLGELKVEGKIGRGDRLVPTTASVRRVHRAGCDGRLHQASGSTSPRASSHLTVSRLRSAREVKLAFTQCKDHAASSVQGASAFFRGQRGPSSGRGSSKTLGHTSVKAVAARPSILCRVWVGGAQFQYPSQYM